MPAWYAICSLVSLLGRGPLAGTLARPLPLSAINRAGLLAARIPDAELTLIEQAGHFVMEEAPDSVLVALRHLLARRCASQPF